MNQAAWDAGKHSATGCGPEPPTDSQFVFVCSTEQMV
jgi:hypothetical protein